MESCLACCTVVMVVAIELFNQSKNAKVNIHKFSSLSKLVPENVKLKGSTGDRLKVCEFEVTRAAYKWS